MWSIGFNLEIGSLLNCPYRFRQEVSSINSLCIMRGIVMVLGTKYEKCFGKFILLFLF